ncbi:MAG: polysaccharide biosynthesis tyrosine autokinase [Bacteroidota bacterium]
MGNPYGDDTIDLKQLLGKFVSKWYLFAICVVLFCGIAYMFARAATNIYQVNASIILNENSNEVTSFESILKNYNVAVPNKSIPNEIGMLSSYRLIKESVKSMDVGISYYSKETLKTNIEYKDVPFSIKVDSAHRQLVWLPIYIERISDSEYRVRASEKEVYLHDIKNNENVRVINEVNIEKTLKVGEPYVDDLLAFEVIWKKDWDTYQKDQYYFTINTLDGLADTYMAGLQVGLVNDEANIVQLSHESPLVEVSKKFINSLLDNYRSDQLAKKRELGERTLEILDGQIAKVDQNLNNIRQELTRVTGGTIDPVNTSVNLSSEISRLKGDRAIERTKLQYLQSIQQRLQSNTNATELPAPTSLGVNDPVLTNLILQLSKQSEELAGMLADLGEASPVVQVQRLKIKNTRTQILENVNSSITASEMMMASLNSRIGSAQGTLGTLPSIKTKTDNIEKDSEVATMMFQNLTEQRNLVELALETVSVDMEIIDSPKQVGKKPIAPNKAFYILVGLILGVGLPAVFIVLQDFFDKSISGYEDIQASTNIPVLGFIARHDRNSSYIVPKDSRTALAESFRSIRIKLQYLTQEGGPQQIIGLTSSSSGEGKTFCATNLAAVFAQSGKRTLLIDIDLRRPRVTRYFENGDGRGLATFLIGEVNDPKEIVHKTHIENLDVIHSGPICTNPLDLIATDKMRDLLDIYRQEYDAIILDTPPVGLVSDYLVIMQMTDFNVYVVRDTTTNVDNLRMINELYDSEKIKNVSILINDVKSLSNYGYIDKYYGYGDE